jgi:hypothetical protein
LTEPPVFAFRDGGSAPVKSIKLLGVRQGMPRLGSSFSKDSSL